MGLLRQGLAMGVVACSSFLAHSIRIDPCPKAIATPPGMAWMRPAGSVFTFAGSTSLGCEEVEGEEEEEEEVEGGGAGPTSPNSSDFTMPFAPGGDLPSRVGDSLEEMLRWSWCMGLKEGCGWVRKGEGWGAGPGLGNGPGLDRPLSTRLFITAASGASILTACKPFTLARCCWEWPL